MNNDIVMKLINDINSMTSKEIKIMEVCGTHTQMISKLGIRTVLNSNIKLISGPGCPVCVTDENFIDAAIDLLHEAEISLITFGDLMKVNGSKGSLKDVKAKGKDIRIVYSPLETIKLAENNKNKKYVFLGVGFETTAPIIALAIRTAYERNIKNLFFFTSIKTMDPILRFILSRPENSVNGLICPGHVACVKGAEYFRFIDETYKIPAAVCGFEAMDIIKGIHHIVNQINNNKTSFVNLYKRCVSDNGNKTADELIGEVFDVCDGNWRGIGSIKDSSLEINKKYVQLNASNIFNIRKREYNAHSRCECGNILLGNKTPTECKLFGKICSPYNPFGPCMVSTEGACSIAYKYGDEYNWKAK